MVKTERRSLVFIYVCPSLLSSLLRLCSFTSLLSSLLCSLHFRTLHFCTCFTYSMYVIHFSLPSSLLSALPCSSLLYVLTVLQITTEFRLPNFLCQYKHRLAKVYHRKSKAPITAIVKKGPYPNSWIVYNGKSHLKWMIILDTWQKKKKSADKS